MVPGYVLLVGVDETAVTYHLRAADVEPVDAMRRREDEPCERVACPRELVDGQLPR